MAMLVAVRTAVLLSAALAAPDAKPDAAPDGAARAELARQLADPATWEQAFCALVRSPRYHVPPPYQEDAENCRVNHVIVAPQRSGAPMYLVVRLWPEITDGARPGGVAGPFTLVDGEGFLIPWASGNTMMGAADQVFRYAGDDRLALAQVVPWGGDDWHAQGLTITPITGKPRTLLSVIVGPPLFGKWVQGSYSWTWALKEQPGRPPTIQIGPAGPDGRLASVAAEWRYLRAEDRYAGPTGGPTQGFLRLNPDDCGCKGGRSPLAEFADAVRKRPPTAPRTGIAPARSAPLAPCRPKTPEHEAAKQALGALGETIARLGPSPAELATANREFGALLASPCFALSAESPRPLVAESAPSLKTWWADGGERWLEHYLELGDDPRTSKDRYVVLPPDLRPALAPGKHVLACEDGAAASCGDETKGWQLRAQTHFADTTRTRDPERPWGFKNPSAEACGKNAGTGPGSYRTWRECVERARTLQPALPLGRFRAPAHGWFVVSGRRGHYDFCDEVRAYDLETGAAFVAQSCSGLVLQRGGTVDFAATGAQRKVAIRTGRVPVDGLQEALFLAALSDEVKDAQVDGEYVRVPAGMAIEWRSAEGWRFDTFHLGWGGSGQTRLLWSWLDDGRVRASGDLTWPTSSRAGDAYATFLLRVAEEALVEEPPRVRIPSWALAPGAAPGVSGRDADPEELDETHARLREALRPFTDGAGR